MLALGIPGLDLTVFGCGLVLRIDRRAGGEDLLVDADSQLLAFVSAAQNFVALIDGMAGISSGCIVEQAVRNLALLYAAGVGLPEVECAEGGGEWIVIDRPTQWAGFEVNYYFEVFDPFVEGDLVVGDLVDDLLDVYCDVKRGLALFERGDVGGAAWEWRFGFESHWGDHAVDALRALQRILTRQRRGEPTRLRAESDDGRG